MPSNQSNEPKEPNLFLEISELRFALKVIWKDRLFVVFLTAAFMGAGLLLSTVIPTTTTARVVIKQIQPLEMQSVQAFWDVFKNSQYYVSLENGVIGVNKISADEVEAPELEIEDLDRTALFNQFTRSLEQSFAEQADPWSEKRFSIVVENNNSFIQFDVVDLPSDIETLQNHIVLVSNEIRLENFSKFRYLYAQRQYISELLQRSYKQIEEIQTFYNQRVLQNELERLNVLSQVTKELGMMDSTCTYKAPVPESLTSTAGLSYCDGNRIIEKQIQHLKARASTQHERQNVENFDRSVNIALFDAGNHLRAIEDALNALPFSDPTFQPVEINIKDLALKTTSRATLIVVMLSLLGLVVSFLIVFFRNSPRAAR